MFRGKDSISRKWIYGEIAKYYDYYIRDNSKLNSSILDGWTRVEAKTVGQRVNGLEDKKHTVIYTGDICSDLVGDLFKIFYKKEQCAFMARYIKSRNAEKKLGDFRLGSICSDGIEVIGNVVDNPELYNLDCLVDK